MSDPLARGHEKLGITSRGQFRHNAAEWRIVMSAFAFLEIYMLLKSARFRALAATTLLTAMCAAPVMAQQKSVAVLAIVEHPALDSVRDGVKEVLAEAGFTEGKNLRWQYQSAQGNVGTAAQIARKFIGDQPDVIVGIATP